jgi:thioredoxin 1
MKTFSFLSLLIIFFSSVLISQSKQSKEKQEVKPKITFIELGSVNCIPCKKMQPVMKAIEQKYGEKVKVLFYDVWTEEQKPFAKKYGIRLIPTQVFLDENGKEFFRHEGFYPEEEIHKIFKQRGITPMQTGG